MPPDDLNPYAIPAELPGMQEPGPEKVYPEPRRHLALWMLGGTVASAMLLTYFDMVVMKRNIGAWPVLIGCILVSLVASVLTRDWIVSPLICFAGTVCGALVAAYVRSWSYAQMDFCVPVAAACSIPALVIALVLQRRASLQWN